MSTYDATRERETPAHKAHRDSGPPYKGELRPSAGATGSRGLGRGGIACRLFVEHGARRTAVDIGRRDGSWRFRALLERARCAHRAWALAGSAARRRPGHLAPGHAGVLISGARARRLSQHRGLARVGKPLLLQPIKRAVPAKAVNGPRDAAGQHTALVEHDAKLFDIA